MNIQVGDDMYVLGLLSGVVFFCVLLLAVYLGYRLGHRKTIEEPSEEEQRKQKQLHEDFQNLMHYDVDTALTRKKVD